MIKTAQQRLVLSIIDRHLQKTAGVMDALYGAGSKLKSMATLDPNEIAAIKNFATNYGDDIGIGVGAAGIAGLGGAAALRNIKALQRTNPGAFARLMGAKPTGLTRGQLNMLGGGLGLGAGVGAGMNAELLEQLAASGYGKVKSLLPAAK
jgi:hypothetical protein